MKTKPRERSERLLVQALLATWDEENALVLADWCEEHLLSYEDPSPPAPAPASTTQDEGAPVQRAPPPRKRRIVGAAEALRSGPTHEAWQAVNALAICVGVRTRSLFAPTNPWLEQALHDDRASTMMPAGMPALDLPPGELVVLETSLPVPAKVERFMFSPLNRDNLVVERIRLGMTDVMANCDPIPARLIDGNDPSVPSMEDIDVLPANTPIVMEVRNVSDIRMTSQIGLRCRALMP